MTSSRVKCWFRVAMVPVGLAMVGTPVPAQGVGEVAQFVVPNPTERGTSGDSAQTAWIASDGMLVIGGTSSDLLGDERNGTSAFLTAVNGSGEVLWWHGYGTPSGTSESGIFAIAGDRTDAIVAGGAVEASPFFLRAASDGSMTTEANLVIDGADRFSGVLPIADEEFLVVAESSLEAAGGGSGALSVSQVDGGGQLGISYRYDEGVSSSHLEFFPLDGGEVFLMTQGGDEAGATPTLHVRILDSEGQLVAEGQRADLDAYPVTHAHPDGQGGFILVRYRAREDLFRDQLRIERTLDPPTRFDVLLDVPIHGELLAGSLTLNAEHFAVVSYSDTTVYLEIVDYARGHVTGYELPVDRNLTQGPTGTASTVLSSLVDLVRFPDGGIALVGTVLIQEGIPTKASIEASTVYVMHIPAALFAEDIVLFSGSPSVLQAIARELLSAFFVEGSERLESLSFAEAVALAPTLRADQFAAMDFDSDGMLSNEELFDVADYGSKEGPGGIAGCTTDVYKMEGDLAVVGAVLLFLAGWDFWLRRRCA